MMVWFRAVRPPSQRSIGARHVSPSRLPPLLGSLLPRGPRTPAIGSAPGPQVRSPPGERDFPVPARHARQSVETDHPPDGAPEHRRQPSAHRAFERIRHDAADDRRGAYRAGWGSRQDQGRLRLTPLTFGGNPPSSFLRARPAISDPVDMSVEPLALVSVSLYLPDITPLTTIHWDGHETAYVAAGNKVADVDFKADSKMTQRLLLSEILVDAPANARAVVAFGNSITDGDGSTVDGNDRWPDRLAERFAKVGRRAGRSPERGHIRRQGSVRPDGNQCARALRHRRPQPAEGRHGHPDDGHQRSLAGPAAASRCTIPSRPPRRSSKGTSN